MRAPPDTASGRGDDTFNVYDDQPRLGTCYWRVRGIGSDGQPVGVWSLPEKIRNQAAVHFDIGIFGDSITQGGDTSITVRPISLTAMCRIWTFLP